MHVPRFPANESFVRFHFAREQSESAICQSKAKTERHEPCGLLSHAKIAGEFTRTDSVLAVHYEPQSRQPLIQANPRFFKNCSSLQRECGALVSAVALPYASLGKVCYLFGVAVRALHLAVRPAKFYHRPVAVLVIREVDDGFLECFYAFHAPNIGHLSRYVKYIVTLDRDRVGWREQDG